MVVHKNIQTMFLKPFNLYFAPTYQYYTFLLINTKYTKYNQEKVPVEHDYLIISSLLKKNNHMFE